jgi:hypothetical protein
MERFTDARPVRPADFVTAAYPLTARRLHLELYIRWIDVGRRIVLARTCLAG